MVQALPDDIEPPTWGEFLEIVRPSLEEAESLIPSMALADLHDAVLLFFRNSVVSASGFDADAPYDYTAVLVHGLVYLAQIQEMEGGWDDDVRAALVTSGCIGSELIGEEESSGDDPQGDTSTATAAPESAPTQTPTSTARATPEQRPLRPRRQRRGPHRSLCPLRPRRQRKRPSRPPPPHQPTCGTPWRVR